jgi:diguanylate cyclase (GGDEF)-like protein/PAS domain S-box-containing protein
MSQEPAAPPLSGDALLAMGKLFRDTFDNAAVGLAHVSPGGHWLRINPALCDTLGYTAEELGQLTFQELTHPDDLGADIGNVQRLLNGDIKRYAMGKRYFHKDGHIVWAQLTVSLIRTATGEPDYFISVVEDVSERRALENKLESGRRQNLIVAEALPCGLIRLDPTLKVQFVNEALAKSLNRPRDELVGHHISELYPPETVLHLQHHANLALHDDLVRFQTGYDDATGNKRHIQVSLAPQKDHDGALTGLIMVVDDVSELVRTQTALTESVVQLRHLAHHDPLTALPNRILFQESLQQALAAARRQLTRVALVFVDLDEFKPVNDQLGHQAGDRVLQETACRMRLAVRESDTVARIGGDEFVLLLPLVSGMEDALNVALKVHDHIAHPMQINGREVCISSSSGIALYPDHAQDADALMSCADSAMYDAKQSGRNQVKVFAPGMKPSPD